MQALGILAVLGSVLLIRQVVVGRASDTPGDLKDVLVSVVTGDFNALGDVLSRHGSDSGGDTVASSPESGSTIGTAPANATETALLAKMIALGSAAKGYRLGGDGPDYYDCSGLVWQALKSIGAFNGPRFTTASFVKALGSKITAVATPTTGDIVLWRGTSKGHMGVIASNGKVYSALSPSNGIGYQSVDDISGSISLTPNYYRIGG